MVNNILFTKANYSVQLVGEETMPCPLCTEYKSRCMKYMKRHIRQHGAQVLACPYCKYKTKIKYHMIRHEKSHTGVGLLKCDLCMFQTTRSDTLRYHIKTNHSDQCQNLMCSSCTFVATSEKDFLEHQQLHLEKKIFSCPMCTYCTIRRGHYNRHVKNHCKDLLQCPRCMFSTKEPEEMKQHVEEHRARGNDIFTCPSCDYMTIKAHHINRHIETHTAKLTCAACEFSTFKKNELDEHIREHLAENYLVSEDSIVEEKKETKSNVGKNAPRKSKTKFKANMKAIVECLLENNKQDVNVDDNNEVTLKRPLPSEEKNQPNKKLKSEVPNVDNCNISIDTKSVDIAAILGINITSTPLSGGSLGKNGRHGDFKCSLCSFETTTKKYLNRHLRRHVKAKLATTVSDSNGTIVVENMNDILGVNALQNENKSPEVNESVTENLKNLVEAILLKNQKVAAQITDDNSINEVETSPDVSMSLDASNRTSPVPDDVIVKSETFEYDEQNFSQLSNDGVLSEATESEEQQLLKRLGEASQLPLFMQLNILSASHTKPISPSPPADNSEDVQPPPKSNPNHPFKCSECPYSTNRRDKLRKHEELHQTHNQDMLTCDQCPYTTLRKEHMKRHMKLHTEGVKYCDKCTFKVGTYF